ncbi:ATP phosphoribosyltransferase regulatory subunit [Butyrivibrio fibrisolvens DSM 3071]|uniref:ATP phosphoribosyltransferase regulatory subunit n=1 Tax=Butyrivibrio fibrisolvens DSM 3071 TaxID=1121131 RepID=A0A1M5ZG17_BUTFI|nr:ATP phosphoribosyltransferase regulatory subunit [Butyrivibrio fibrisolvens]SHI23198.1 ATP phosphoribosyltransferase regulatory subunit [Butyrivibrio fibrisolvens DSM 3071]
MSKELVHTPEGVRDVYGRESYERSTVKHKIKEIMYRYGYENILTPTFEFFDVFAKEISQASARDLYKFFDNEGNTLVLRPDFTPSVARCIAKYFMEDTEPVRICYSGNIFINTHRLQGKLREHTQMGAELMCDGSVNADAEMIAMMIESIRATGLTDFKVTIGDADYFKGIIEEAGIDEDTEDQLREYLSGRNYSALEDYLHNLVKEGKIESKFADILIHMPDFTTADELEEGAADLVNSRSRSSIERLKNLYHLLDVYGASDNVSFDLAMLSEYNYYTGVMFRAYTYGVGDAIAKGGRYDNLLSKFGKDAPAIGYMVDLEYLMSALYNQKIDIPYSQEPEVVTYNDSNYEEKLAQVQRKRAQGYYIVLKHE